MASSEPHECIAGVDMVNRPVILRAVSEHRIDIREAGVVLTPASEFVWLNGRMHDSATDRFGAASGGSGN